MVVFNFDEYCSSSVASIILNCTLFRGLNISLFFICWIENIKFYRRSILHAIHDHLGLSGTSVQWLMSMPTKNNTNTFSLSCRCSLVSDACVDNSALLTFCFIFLFSRRHKFTVYFEQHTRKHLFWLSLITHWPDKFNQSKFYYHTLIWFALLLILFRALPSDCRLKVEWLYRVLDKSNLYPENSTSSSSNKTKYEYQSDFDRNSKWFSSISVYIIHVAHTTLSPLLSFSIFRLRKKTKKIASQHYLLVLFCVCFFLSPSLWFVQQK